MHTDEKTDGNEDKQMDTKTEKIFKNQHCCQCWSPRYRVSVLSTKCGGCHPKGLIVASSYKIKKNHININFNVPVPILLFMRQEKKNQLNFYFIPLVPLTKNLENIKFSFVCRTNLEGLMAYVVSYFGNSIQRKLSMNGGISSFI